MSKVFNIIELFSGIGSQARALKNIGIPINVLGTCEWDIHAFVAYSFIHKVNNDKMPNLSKEVLIEELSKNTLSSNGKEAMPKHVLKSFDIDLLKNIYSAIKDTKNFVDINKVSGETLPSNLDILTYSFPCQDLSNVGAFHGYNKGIDPDSGSRSSLLWQVGRILNEMANCEKKLPRYLLMENVPSLLSPRHKPNFEIWKKLLENLGYISKEVELNAKYFGILQNRPRLLMLSVFVGSNEQKKELIQDFFSRLDSHKIIFDYQKSKFFKKYEIRDLLRIPPNNDSILWNEALACTPNDTPSRQKIWDENPKIIDEKGNLTKENYVRTLTTKQDRNPNSGNIYFDTNIKGRSKFRYLTPRECFLFMGFTDDDYESLIKNNPRQRKNVSLFTRDKIIRMAGNSIPVKLLEGFFYQLYELEGLLKE